MKKLFSLLLSAAAIISVFSVHAFADDSINVTVNGESVSFARDQRPVIQNGRVLVPLRAVFEKMGADVKWFEDIKLCEVTYGQVTAGIEIGSTKVTVGDGSYVTSDVAAQIINGRTMIPLRVISECIGAVVDWDNVTKTVAVTTPETLTQAPDTVEYEINMGGGNNITKGLSIDYEYPGISSKYTMANRLNENIQNDIFEAVDKTLDEYEGDKKELYVKCNVVYNNSGLINIHYLIDDELFYEATYGIINGNRIEDEDVKNYIFPLTEENNESPYYIETYSTTMHDANGNDYITATAEYPVFNTVSHDVEKLNTLLENTATGAAENFIGSYGEEAKKAYEDAHGKMSAIPYSYYQRATVVLDGDIAEVTETITESQYNKDDTKTDKTYKIDLTTGEIIS